MDKHLKQQIKQDDLVTGVEQAAGFVKAHQHEVKVTVAAVVVAVLGSLMVSYTRARAEALGVECKVGLATRPVRVVVLSIGLVFAKGAGIGDFELLEPSVYVLAALTVITVAQRIWHVRQELVARERAAQEVTPAAEQGTTT